MQGSVRKQRIPNGTLTVLHPVEPGSQKMVSASLQVNRIGIGIGILAFLISAIYATIRYNLIQGASWSDWPVFTLNKAFGVSSLLLLVVAVVRYRLRPLLSNAKILYMSGLFGGIHILISCMLLSPAYYEKLFLDGKLTAIAGLSMLWGAVAAVLFISKAAKKDSQAIGTMRSLALVCCITALHVAFQGFQSWLTPYDWPGFIPPLTLISFLGSIVALLVTINTKRNK